MELEEVHDCPQCHGKMVSIEVDLVGNTYCGYCHQRVDYSKWIKANVKMCKSCGARPVIDTEGLCPECKNYSSE